MSSVNCKTVTSAVLSALGAFLFGLDIGYIAPILECASFKRDVAGITDPKVKLSDAVEGFVVGSFSVGCIVTSFPTVSGYFMEEWGRRDSIILGTAFFLAGCVVQAAAHSINIMLAGRFIAGMSIGLLSPVVALYQSEVAPTSARGALSSLYQLMITLGILVASVVDTGLVEKDSGWRWAIGMQVVPAVVLVAGMPLLPRSPRWLVHKGRIEEAQAAMRAMRETEEEATRELNEVIEAADKERKKVKVGVSEYMDILTVRMVMLGVSLQILQQLVGMNAFMYFGPRMFGDMGLNENKFQVIINLLNFLMTWPAIFLSDLCGRRFLLWTGAAAMLVACFGMGSLGTLVLKTGTSGQESVQYCMVSLVFLFVAAFAATWGPTVWVYNAEIFPQKHRAWCIGLTTTANWIGNWAIAQFTPVMLGALGFGTFFVFGFFTLSALLLALWLPETKGVMLEHMDHIFRERMGLGMDARLQSDGASYGSTSSSSRGGRAAPGAAPPSPAGNVGNRAA